MRNSLKTHCKWNHEFTPENTHVDPKTGWRYCKTCRRDTDREHQKSDVRWNARLLRKYGITVEQFREMAKAQDYRCGICRQKCVERGSRSQANLLVVDHDHETGRVRGLLCHRCNKVIGMCADDATILDAMASWVRPIGMKDQAA